MIVGGLGTAWEYAQELHDEVEEPVQPKVEQPASKKMAFFVSWGNSDDRLTQQQWALFCSDVRVFVDTWSSQVQGWWASLPNEPWQNAAAAFNAFVVDAHQVELMRADLRLIAQRWKQHSIVFSAIEPEFIGPSTGEQRA